MLVQFVQAFVLGMLTPLTAVCVLPLYPGFLSYLSSQVSEKSPRSTLALFGVIVTAGVISFMLLFGLIFSFVFKVSLTKVIGVVSPIAFFVLAIVSLLLIFNVDFQRFIPKIGTPKSSNPKVSAFFFGFGFGAIVVPCNPLFIAALFTTAISFGDFVSSLVQFVLFGAGIGFPLLLFSVVSAGWSRQVIGFLTRYSRVINLVSGVLMLLISLYYLVCVFGVVGLSCPLM